jgi:C-terminal processing protease CtpA/Prc
VNGTTEWALYTVSVPVLADARQLHFGFIVRGTGTAWLDGLRLLVDGKPIADAPKAERPKTVFDSDHEFDSGSKISPVEPGPIAIENLTMLCKVWGFLKYHHPAVTSGQRHWDYDLFRVMPAVLAAPDRETANAAIARWVASLGPVADCKSCAKLEEAELHLRPDLDWIGFDKQLGAELSHALQAIYRNRPSSATQFYVSLAPQIGNPVFQHELAYDAGKALDPGYRLLALFRFWNMIRYWYPYRDVIGEDWDQALRDSIPRFVRARTFEQFQVELIALIARVHDTHANLWGSLQYQPPTGKCRVPVNVRFIEDRATVVGYRDAVDAKATPLKLGDVIESVDGVPVEELIQRWRPYYGASNDAAMRRDMANKLTQGMCGAIAIHLQRGAESLDLSSQRLPEPSYKPAYHDLPGDTFRRLSGEVAYLKMSSVKVADAASYVERAVGTKGLIIDLRNYPSEFLVFALGSLLVEKATPFVRFTQPDLSNPGAFHFYPPLSLAPATPHYGGEIVILVDEVTQSSAEYTSMAFRSAPNAFVIGSMTAGADGNVSAIPLPGGLQTMISGIGVFYPDKRPTQRVGIVPDLDVRPTLAGIRAGRDEVLEAAVRRILGPGTPEAEVRKLANPGPK